MDKAWLAVAGAACALLSAGGAQAGTCRDPWVTRAVREVAQREPNGSGETGECNIRNYGGGSWSSYNDLLGKVRAVVPAPLRAAPLGKDVTFAAPTVPMGKVISAAQMAKLQTKMINGRMAVLIDGQWCYMVAAGGGNFAVASLIGNDAGSILSHNGALLQPR